jgi:AcrR family transcriptional regulator
MAPRPRTIPRKQPSQERSKAMVDVILRATARVLVKEGYDKTSTNKVAAAAGVSVGSLYQYFPSKEALVAALIERHTADMVAIIEQAAEAYMDAPLEVAVRGVVATMIAVHRVDPVLHRVVIEQVPRIGRMQRIEEVEERSLLLITLYLKNHAKELRRANVELAAFLVSQIIETVTHGTVLRHAKYLDDDSLIEEATDLVMRYLVADS